MRNIKFRVWDIERNFLATIITAIHFNIDELPTCVEYCDDNSDMGCVVETGEGEFILLQYTGLKDKNGRDIYDGDVLDISSSYHSGKYLAVVEFRDPVSGVQLDTFKDDCKIGVLGKEWWGNQKCQHLYQVIGNIYENPELLKGTE